MSVGPVSAAIEAGAAALADREALVSRELRLTYRELAHAAERAAGVLWAAGARPGDRVAGCAANRAELAVAFFAAMRVGAVWVGVNPALAPPEVAWLLGDSGAAILVGDPAAVAGADCPVLREVVAPSSLLDGPAAAAPPVSTDLLSPAAIAYTSGTTGRPKGAVHSQYNLMVVATGAGGKVVPAPGDRIGVCLPLALLNLTILGPLTAVANGATCVLADRLDPVGLAGWIEGEQIGAMAVVPTILHDLVTHSDVDVGALMRTFRPSLGGSDCPPAWRDLFARHGVHAAQNYGLTEAPTAVTASSPDQPPGSSGRPLPHISVTVVGPEDGRPLPTGHVGEICLAPAASGPCAGVYRPMLGYWNRPEETARALAGGLLHTRDMGWLDHDGWLYVADRREDLIVRGGANVYPAEVERVLNSDPRVRGSAVVGMPDDRLGQRVWAAVEPVSGAAVSGDQLREACSGQLARYKIPDRIVVVERLPRTSMGKVRRAEVAGLLGGHQR